MVTDVTTEAEWGQSKYNLQIQKSISNRNISSQITVKNIDTSMSKQLLQILRKLVNPQMTFSIIRKYFASQ